MSGGDASHNSPKGATPADKGSLEAGKALLGRSRLIGRCSAVFFLLAALAVADALQTLVRHEFNSIDLVPGEEVLVSGMLPADAAGHEDLRVLIEGADGLVFEPLETYKGFWMGGRMWRARLAAAPGMAPGKAVVTVVDIVKPDAGGGAFNDERDRSILFGGRQNPALVHTVTVWASDAERRAEDISVFRRYTGLPAFGVAAGAVLFALACGVANWRVFGRAEALLAENRVFFIHGVKDQTGGADGPLSAAGYKAIFAHAGQPLYKDEPVLLCDRQWTEQGRGRLVEADKHKGYALFPPDGARPRYGWLAVLTRDSP